MPQAWKGGCGLDGCRLEVEKPGSLRSHGQASRAFQKERKTVMLPDPIGPSLNAQAKPKLARQLGWERIAVDSIGKFRAEGRWQQRGGCSPQRSLVDFRPPRSLSFHPVALPRTQASSTSRTPKAQIPLWSVRLLGWGWRRRGPGPPGIYLKFKRRPSGSPSAPRASQRSAP
jgi:hypothetical protein